MPTCLIDHPAPHGVGHAHRSGTATALCVCGPPPRGTKAPPPYASDSGGAVGPWPRPLFLISLHYAGLHRAAAGRGWGALVGWVKASPGRQPRVCAAIPAGPNWAAAPECPVTSPAGLLTERGEGGGGYAGLFCGGGVPAPPPLPVGTEFLKARRRQRKLLIGRRTRGKFGPIFEAPPPPPSRWCRVVKRGRGDTAEAAASV